MLLVAAPAGTEGVTIGSVRVGALGAEAMAPAAGILGSAAGGAATILLLAGADIPVTTGGSELAFWLSSPNIPLPIRVWRININIEYLNSNIKISVILP